MLTDKYFQSLPPCEVRYFSDWLTGYRFVRRGKRWITVAIKTVDGRIHLSKHSFGAVRVNGRELAYSATKPNPRRPDPYREPAPGVYDPDLLLEM